MAACSGNYSVLVFKFNFVSAFLHGYVCDGRFVKLPRRALKPLCLFMKVYFLNFIFNQIVYIRFNLAIL
jgi:hypothetical protein